MDDKVFAVDSVDAPTEGGDSVVVLVVHEDPGMHTCIRNAMDRSAPLPVDVQLVFATHRRAAAAQLITHPQPVLILLSNSDAESFDRTGLLEQLRRTPEHEHVFIALFCTGVGRNTQANTLNLIQRFRINAVIDSSTLSPDCLTAILTTALHNQHLLRRLQDSEHRARLIFEGANDGIYVTDEDFVILDANPAAAEILGRSIDELRGTHVLAHLPTTHVTRLPAKIRAYLRDGHFEEDFPVVRKDGSTRLCRISGRRVTSKVFVNIMHDVTRQRRDEAMIRRIAFTDLTTGLPNFSAFERHLADAIDAARRHSHTVAVLIVRIGNFRALNDTVGHDNGNLMLRAIGQRIRDALFKDDLVARLGGSQFVILIRRLNHPDEIEKVTSKLQDALRQRFEIAELPISAQASLGCALFPQDGLSPMPLLRCADVALGHARRTRQAYVKYSAAIDPHTPERLSLVHDLERALHNGELQVWYQPKIDLRADRVFGAEALLRWTHPRNGPIGPDEFIAAAENTSLIDDITVWVAEQAIAQVRQWHNAGQRLEVCINLSLHNLRTPGMAHELAQRIIAAGLPAGSITVELTESAVMQDPELVHQTLRRLRDNGVGVALDDFGIGQSSLAHLMRLPVSELKLDKSFVIDLASTTNTVIVRNTIRLAHDLGLRVTAEGVETREALAQLRQMGCDAAQGFLFSRAMPAAEFDRWLAARD
ncbi:EAL domain-containing protein [Sinimarinibacterium sp. CAU 1509]|uniref:putative bifunctional diguanylate cyclase/phosphodiesterase n=1 Tax=Sinimarinibacterium sp. CAU 1509 TaxID=2562283 RepID=UPI0010AC277B|nr:bifunctional diguanylate cyclase/phosphodiesterase [Sinimarinibacterium sp. CAU 1509]TJY59449.1 EAL domain-containing protein [Sinimarinibacterium sp. CAU 1509]